MNGESLSYSWSNIDGSIENAQVKWNCTALGENNSGNNRRRLLQIATTTFATSAPISCDYCPSVVTNEPILEIAADTLGDCLYAFDLEIDNGGSTGTDSIIINAQSKVPASVTIQRDSYCIDFNNKITLSALVTTDIDAADGDINVVGYLWDETTNYLNLDESIKSTFEIAANTLDPQQIYTFAVTVGIEVGNQAPIEITATIDLEANDTPKITRYTMTEDNNNDNTIEQTFTFAVESTSPFPPNSYQFFWRYRNDTLTEDDNIPLTGIITSPEVKNIYLPEGDLVLTATAYDLCGGFDTQTLFPDTINHNLDDVTCEEFYIDIVQPLFITASSVKDYNRVLNVFAITTETIQRLQLQANNGDDAMNMTISNTTNSTYTMLNMTTTTTEAPSTCFSDIVDSFAMALASVTEDLDPCIEDTTILQQQLLTAIDLTGDDLSAESNTIFNNLVDLIWAGCNTDDDEDGLPLCSEIDIEVANITNSNDTICINETSTIFSGILTPDQIFRGDAVTEQQISITTALMDSVLSSSSLTCTDIQATIYNIFSLLENIVSTDLPTVNEITGEINDATTISSANGYFEGFVQRVPAGRETTITFSDNGDSITIPSTVTSAGLSIIIVITFYRILFLHQQVDYHYFE